MSEKKVKNKNKIWLIVSIIYFLVMMVLIFKGNVYVGNSESLDSFIKKVNIKPLDKKDYDRRMYMLAGYSTTSYAELLAATTTATGTKPSLWPVKTVYPLAGAILPFHRVVAYYGNFLSTGMGALGADPEEIMLPKLQAEVDKWTAADPETPAIPAIHYIAVTAQGRAGDDGKYRARMSDTEIEKAITMANKINGIVILDIQVGQSTIQEELPLLEKYLKLPQVHLAIDPEFSMKFGRLPGIYVGTYDAEEINYVTDYLIKIVQDNNLPPKIFVIHRYTENMLTNYKLIKTVPEVQIVINMDGWGPETGKLATQKAYVYKQPVQFTGFKIFYKNDLWKPSTAMMTPKEVLELKPKPVYIQYQ